MAPTTDPPALYARWFRVDLPSAADSAVARCWRNTSPGDRAFWTGLAAVLTTIEAAEEQVTHCRALVEYLAGQLEYRTAWERQQ